MSQATLGSTTYRNSNLFSSYYLDERVDDLDAWDCNEDAEAAFEELQHLWELEGGLVASYKEDELLTSWIDDVLDILGFGTLAETTLPDKEGYNDRLLFESDEVRRDASLRKRDGEVEAMYGLASAVLEAKRWDADFTKRFSETRSYRDASHQIKYYLEHTPEQLQWGILTDGKTWRLYGTKDYATETYYEVNLPELLESGNLEKFKYFYLFFRPEAFREVSGTSFLETVWNESETAAQELGEDLQDNVFTALRVLGEGFIETNDLSIDPTDKAAREELKEQSLVLLYRLMFVLYSESRHLISPDEPRKRTEFKENFSLDELRQEIHEDITSGGSFEDYSEYSTSMWGRLEDLFRLIDSGEKSLGIPPYNGGLFDNASHEFLAINEVSDRYIAEVVYRLGTTLADDGDGFVLADYADLDTRHLGTIYEGLLEHEFRIASEQYAAVAEDGGQVWKPATVVSVADAVETVETGELYVVNDDGERKATGAYYTPDYVVTFIVEQAIDPLLEDIDKELRQDGLNPSDREYFAQFWQSVLGLKVLDPAMGSGHFLTKATGYLTEQVMEVVREQEIQSYDEQDLRRQIAKECIYGVDVNGMAVELAKLSMWLETLATDKPLAFLDHHLKTGNSLVGSDITEVLSDDIEEDGGQLTLMQAAARVRRRTLEHVMELMQDLLAIDNEKLEDIKSMEELYDEIRDDPLYGRLFELANIHTAEQFGLDLPEGVYEQMAGAIEDVDEWNEIRKQDWFISAQAVAKEEDFFHWELEYPEAFFGAEGEKRENAGFDAVVGNPPYVRQEQIRQLVDYLAESYDAYSSAADLYTYFVERGHHLLSDDSNIGYIVSNKFTKSEYGKPLRQFLLENSQLRLLCDFRDLPVFGPTVSAYPMILIAQKSPPTGEESVTLSEMQSLNFTYLQKEIKDNRTVIEQEFLHGSSWSMSSPQLTKLCNRIEKENTKLESYTKEDIYWGIKTGLNEAFIIDRNTKEKIVNADSDSDQFLFKLMRGDNTQRYISDFSGEYLIRVPSGWTFEESGVTEEDEAWEWFRSQYPGLADYLSEYQDGAASRYDRGKCWWELRPCDYYDKFDNEKIVYPEISGGPRFSLDKEGKYINNKCFMIPQNDYELIGILNSKVGEFWAQNRLSTVRGGYLEYRTVHLSQFPVPDLENPRLRENVIEIIDYIQSRRKLNTSLLDHLGAYEDGSKLADIGFTQPPKNAAESVLQETTEQKPNLRIGRAEISRESNSTVELRLSARYKPNDETEHETDRWGYTETKILPALRITDLSSAQADLIEAFVPVAVDKAGGFAGFRETATKTNSLVDRLKLLTLPRLSDVRDGLKSFTETKIRAGKLQEQISQTDDQIDQIVYDLYGLTDEEIGLVEEAVSE